MSHEPYNARCCTSFPYNSCHRFDGHVLQATSRIPRTPLVFPILWTRVYLAIVDAVPLGTAVVFENASSEAKARGAMLPSADSSPPFFSVALLETETCNSRREQLSRRVFLFWDSSRCRLRREHAQKPKWREKKRATSCLPWVVVLHQRERSVDWPARTHARQPVVSVHMCAIGYRARARFECQPRSPRTRMLRTLASLPSPTPLHSNIDVFLWCHNYSR